MNITSLIVIIVVLYLALTAAVYLGQRSLLYHPDTNLQSPTDYGALQMMELRTSDTENLVHWYAKGAQETSPVIVLFHGNAGNIGHRAFKAQVFANKGYGILLAGYRGYGGNTGNPTEEGLYQDARSALIALQGMGVENSQIILYGESLGTGVAVQMATEGYGTAMILEAAYSSMPDVAFHHYPIFPVGLLMKDRFSSIEKIGQISLEVFFVHGQKDTVIPIKFGKKLYAAASGPKVWKRIDTAGHNDLYDHGAATEILNFIADHYTE